MSGLTSDSVLGGRVKLIQPKRGHRVGHDAILLAAATDAKPLDRVVDLGAGVGGAGLALAARVEPIYLTLVEIAPQLAKLAQANARLNGKRAWVDVLTLDVGAPARLLAAAGLKPGSASRVMMNPPFNDPTRQRRSPDPARATAHSAERDALAVWCKAAARLLADKGALTMIWRADGLADVLASLGRWFGAVSVLPVYPRPDAPAVRVLVRAVKGSRAPLSVLPGLVLNNAEGDATVEADAILRDAQPLHLAPERGARRLRNRS